MSMTVFTEPTQSMQITGPLTLISDPQTKDIGFLTFDGIAGNVPASTVTQAPANGSAITMTGSGRIILVSGSASAGVSQSLAPTSSALTGTSNFTNGLEVTLVNVGASSFVIPSASGGPGNAATTISGGASARFIYIASLQVWSHLA